MSTQVQGLSDNLEEINSRLGKLNQQLLDLQNSMPSLDATASGAGAAAPPPGLPSPPRNPLRLRELGRKSCGARHLREVSKPFPGSDEARLARAKLKELGVPITATASR